MVIYVKRRWFSMTKVRTTVYVDSEDKAKIRELSRKTMIPEAALWRKALSLLLQKYRTKPLDREKILETLREDFIRYNISKVYDKYKEEERKLEKELHS